MAFLPLNLIFKCFKTTFESKGKFSTLLYIC